MEILQFDESTAGNHFSQRPCSEHCADCGSALAFVVEVLIVTKQYVHSQTCCYLVLELCPIVGWSLHHCSNTIATAFCTRNHIKALCLLIHSCYTLGE